MKKLLLILFCLSNILFANESIDGFGDIKFGEPAKKLKNYKIIFQETMEDKDTNSKQKYTIAEKVGDKLKIDNIRVSKIEYTFLDDKLQKVSISSINGMKNMDKMVNALSKKYGEFHHDNKTNSYFLNSKNGGYIYIGKNYEEDTKSRQNRDLLVEINAPVSLEADELKKVEDLLSNGGSEGNLIY